VSADNGATGRDWTQDEAKLLVRTCNGCAHRWYFRRARCPRCASPDLAACVSEGRGTVVATTTIHRAPAGAAIGEVPFSIALVDLDEGIRVMGRCTGSTGPGDRVAAQIQEEVDGKGVPFFKRQGETR
jgi:uncharacterized OB-fold protein